MADVKNFKCPCCGANLTYNAKEGEMTCEYCDSHFTMEEVKAAQEAEQEFAQASDMNWNATEPPLVHGWSGNMDGYRCPSCNAEMVIHENAAATECPYCGNPTIVAQSFSGIYRPDLVIPFKVDKNEASNMMKTFVKGKKLLPSSFLEQNRIEKITGLYVPFWLYSCHARGSVAFEGIKKKHWSDQRYNYEREDYYHVVRRGEMDFKRIPADASSQMDDAMMDSIEPFDYSKAVPYDAAYFSGYLANRYDMKAKDTEERANERVRNTFYDTMKEAVQNYDTVKDKADNIQLSQAKAEYAMLPVWMLSTRYEDKVYSFGINGQTGKMVGDLPVDKSKYFKYLAIAFAICMVLGEILLFFMNRAIFKWQFQLAAVACSLLIGFLYAQYLKGEMKTVEQKHYAEGYMVPGSLHRGPSTDRFLYSKTQKTEKPKQQ